MIFKSKSYLTIDDSASERMDDLVDYLYSKNIPAIFFCRGDMLDKNTPSAIRAVQKGFVLANHAYSHQRASQKSYDWIVAEIERTENILENIYALAKIKKSGKYFRFPQLDRGTAGWIVDYDVYDGEARDDLLKTFAQGLNVQSMDRPSSEDFAKKEALQNYLKQAGYVQPFLDITKPWYQLGEVTTACDCLYTFSNCDWMVTERHKGKWPYKTLQDLKDKARGDVSLTGAGNVNIILAHDQDEIIDVTIDLIEDLAKNGMEFLPIL